MRTSLARLGSLLLSAPLLALLLTPAGATGCQPEIDTRSPEVNQPPVVVLDVPSTLAVGERFDALAVASFDVDGEIVEAIMRFGDGSQPELFLRATHSYDAPGMYVLEVFVADDLGLRASARQRIVVR